MTKRTIPATHISAAMATSESAVAAPSRSKPGSMKSQIEALEPGGYCAKLQQVDRDIVLSAFVQEAPQMREQLRNTLTSTVAKAKELTGGTYTIEVGDMIMRSNLYLVAVISRVE